MEYEFPEGKAEKIWNKNGIDFSIVRCEGSVYAPRGWYCGYCRFPERPTIEQGYSGILNYVPVHGGITYSAQDDDGTMVYGFDCAHAGDEHRDELFDLDRLSAECEQMAFAIEKAAEVERAYVTAATDEQKAVIIDDYHSVLESEGIVFKLTDNFGAMLNVLAGKL